MGAGVEVWAAQAAAWLGAALAVPSSQDAVDLWGTLGGCWSHQAEQPALRRGRGEQGARLQPPRSRFLWGSQTWRCSQQEMSHRYPAPRLTGWGEWVQAALHPRNDGSEGLA